MGNMLVIWTMIVGILVTGIALREIYKTYWRRQFVKIFDSQPKTAELTDVFEKLLILRVPLWDLQMENRVGWKNKNLHEHVTAIEDVDRLKAAYLRARRAATVFGFF